jgi:hypothetical protein
MTSTGHVLDAPPGKGYLKQKEDIENGGRRRQSSIKHGDRALAIIGDDRVSLTDEDVCITALIRLIVSGAIYSPFVMLEVTSTDHFREQTYQTKD